MRLCNPVKTLPAPTSRTEVTPLAAIQSTDSRHRTIAVTCCTRHARISAASPDTGAANTFATSGIEGVRITVSASASAIRSAAGCIIEQ